MSMNPERTFGSALPAHVWSARGYLTAPVYASGGPDRLRAEYSLLRYHHNGGKRWIFDVPTGSQYHYDHHYRVPPRRRNAGISAGAHGEKCSFWSAPGISREGKTTGERPLSKSRESTRPQMCGAIAGAANCTHTLIIV
jgi:hypothetical protein